MLRTLSISIFFFFNDTATTEIYTLSLHDALPISDSKPGRKKRNLASTQRRAWNFHSPIAKCRSATASETKVKRSEEHTSELQSPCNLVCRLLLEKKKKNYRYTPTNSIHTNQHDLA